MLSKLWNNRFVRIVLIIISLIFIAGGAFNDGPNQWSWALPFICLLYFSMTGTSKIKTIITVLVFILMYGISSYKDRSFIVYPVISQEVTFSEDTLLKYSNKYYPAAEREYNHLEEQGKSVTRNYIIKGSVFTVSRVTHECGEMIGTDYCIIMSNSDREIEVASRFIVPGDIWMTDPKYIKEDSGITGEAFCAKVHWDYCLNPKPIMAQPFRALSNLMWYPFSPLLLYLWISSH